MVYIRVCLLFFTLLCLVENTFGQAPNPPCSDLACGPYSTCNQNENGVSECGCTDFCTRQYRPVCGSDNVTYSNLCEMMRSSCRSKQLVTVASRGRCNFPQITCASILCVAGATCKMLPGGQYGCECNDVCPEIYQPVCGSNGTTFSSRCHLEIASCKSSIPISVAHEGQCRDSNNQCDPNPCNYHGTCFNHPDGHYCRCSTEMCPQTFRYDPICGSDNVTYPGECEMNKASCEASKNIALAYRGECSINPCSLNPCQHYSTCRRGDNGTYSCHCSTEMCPLTFRYDPICGSDGITYPGECEMKKASCQKQIPITLHYRGECNKTGSALCGPDGCQHYSTCMAQADGAYRCVCNELCTEEYEPVCGSNNQTYSNLCGMKAASCREKKTVTLEHIGACRTVDDPCMTIRCGYHATCGRRPDHTIGCYCNSACTEQYQPVCGTNSITYSNLCFLHLAACRLNRDIRAVYRGECSANTTNPCADVTCPYGKICLADAQGKTECIYNVVCTDEFLPVCGSDGVTYPNECSIRCKDGVSVLHSGRCGDSFAKRAVWIAIISIAALAIIIAGIIAIAYCAKSKKTFTPKPMDKKMEVLKI